MKNSKVSVPVKHSTQIVSSGKPLADRLMPTVTEPFTAGRATPRLLFDFSVMASLLKPSVLDLSILDFGAGTGWVSEFCARMGFRTVAFVEAQKKHDLTWIERDVVLEEIDQIAREAGFEPGLSIVPMPHPLALQMYSMVEWKRFRDGDILQRLRLTDQLAQLNYWDRVIFFIDKPE